MTAVHFMWRGAMRLLATACLPLAGLGAYDSAVAYWSNRGGDPQAAMLASAPSVRWGNLEPLTHDAKWLSENRATARSAALALLREAPLNATALRALGTIAVLDGKGNGTSQWRTAERITRRDVATQLALIEFDGRTGDIVDGMRHYDHLLRSAPETESVLFSTLADAITYDDVREALVAYGDRPWFQRFLAAACRDGSNPAPLIDLYRRALPAIGPAVRRTVGLGLAGYLVRIGRHDEARSITTSIPGFVDRGFDTLDMNAGTTDASYAPFAWTLRNDEAVTSDLGRDGRLSIRVISGRTMPVAERTMLTAPGRYLLSHAVVAQPGDPIAALTWEVTCQDSRTLIQFHVSPSDKTGQFKTTIDIPPDCLAQTWHLSATPEETQSASSVTLSRISLVRQ